MSNKKVNRLVDMTWPEVEKAIEYTQTLLLPVGSTEQHGHHLPLGVDVYIPSEIAEEVAINTGCLLAAPVWYGVSPHHMFKPGTFSIGTETFQKFIRDIGASAAKWGVENFIILNGHYLAQDSDLTVVVRELKNEFGLEAINVPIHRVFEKTASEVRKSNVAFHAGEFETSCMLELHPSNVHLDRAVPVEPANDIIPVGELDVYGDNRFGWAFSADEMQAITDAGNIGDPTVATAETGRKLIDEAVTNVSKLVEGLG